MVNSHGAWPEVDKPLQHEAAIKMPTQIHNFLLTANTSSSAHADDPLLPRSSMAEPQRQMFRKADCIGHKRLWVYAPRQSTTSSAHRQVLTQDLFVSSRMPIAPRHEREERGASSFLPLELSANYPRMMSWDNPTASPSTTKQA
jgi:hypothetical protein